MSDEESEAIKSDVSKLGKERPPSKTKPRVPSTCPNASWYATLVAGAVARVPPRGVTEEQ